MPYVVSTRTAAASAAASSADGAGGAAEQHRVVPLQGVPARGGRRSSRTSWVGTSAV